MPEVVQRGTILSSAGIVVVRASYLDVKVLSKALDNIKVSHCDFKAPALVIFTLTERSLSFKETSCPSSGVLIT